MVKLYGYKKCGTCKKAEKYFSDLDIEYKYIDITEEPPGLSLLKKYFKNSELPLKKLFNTSGQVYRSENIKEKLPHLSESEALKLLAGNGKLIKRPLVVDGDFSYFGFKEETYDEHFTS
jgi:arsenate reductase